MELRSTEESRTNITGYSNRYLNLLLEKKKIDEDIKALKQEFKEEGVPIGIVNKAINVLKTRKKKTDSEIFEEETIQGWLETDKDTDDKITELVE